MITVFRRIGLTGKIGLVGGHGRGVEGFLVYGKTAGHVDPVAVASMGVSLEDVRSAISNANSMSPLGTFEGGDLARTIGPNDQLRAVRDYENIVVKSANGTVVQRFGKYLTIWRKQPGGEWRFVVDGGNLSPTPNR